MKSNSNRLFLAQFSATIFMLTVMSATLSYQMNRGGTYIDPELGFSFEYPKGFYISKTSSSSKPIDIIPFSTLFSGRSFPRIIVYSNTEYPHLTPAEWVKTRNWYKDWVGYGNEDPLDKHTTRLIAGQEAISLFGTSQVFFNSPDGDLHMEVSSFEMGSEPLDEEFEIIVGSMTFNN